MGKKANESKKYEIGLRIKQIRENIGMSQRELANMLGISVSRMSNWEQGINRPDADMIGALCSALEVSPSELLNVRLTDEEFTGEERQIVKAYRSKPELQHAVKVLLGIDTGEEQ